jgi:hypothetical protein
MFWRFFFFPMSFEEIGAEDHGFAGASRSGVYLLPAFFNTRKVEFRPRYSIFKKKLNLEAS